MAVSFSQLAAAQASACRDRPHRRQRRREQAGTTLPDVQNNHSSAAAIRRTTTGLGQPRRRTRSSAASRTRTRSRPGRARASRPELVGRRDPHDEKTKPADSKSKSKDKGHMRSGGLGRLHSRKDAPRKVKAGRRGRAGQRQPAPHDRPLGVVSAALRPSGNKQSGKRNQANQQQGSSNQAQNTSSAASRTRTCSSLDRARARRAELVRGGTSEPKKTTRSTKPSFRSETDGAGESSRRLPFGHAACIVTARLRKELTHAELVSIALCSFAAACASGRSGG